MKTVVIGVIGADVHAVGNKIIDYVLTENGYNVVNIGVLSSQEDFINAAIETDAHAILISSLYGHGEMDCRYMKEQCDEAGLNKVKLYVQRFRSNSWHYQNTEFPKPAGVNVARIIKQLLLQLWPVPSVVKQKCLIGPAPIAVITADGR